MTPFFAGQKKLEIIVRIAAKKTVDFSAAQWMLRNREEFQSPSSCHLSVKDAQKKGGPN